MALNAKNVKNKGNVKKHPPLDEGTYPARLVQVIDMGVQPQRAFQGKEKPPAQEISLTYEFLDEFLKDEDGNDDPKNPRWLSETMPLHSLNSDKARSTKRYYALDPKGKADGDFAALVGTPVMVTLVHNARDGEPDSPYVNVSSISTMRPKEADKAAELVHPPKVFDLSAPDLEVFFSLPDWLQDKIKANLDFGGSKLEKALKNHKGGGKKEEEPEEETEEKEEDSEGEW